MRVHCRNQKEHHLKCHMFRLALLIGEYICQLLKSRVVMMRYKSAVLVLPRPHKELLPARDWPGEPRLDDE